jgi:hypothetical protein
VSIKLMVSNWNTDALELPYLKSLAVLPNVQIKIVTLPQAKQGFIPYARVIHSKTLEIDGQWRGSAPAIGWAAIWIIRATWRWSCAAKRWPSV